MNVPPPHSKSGAALLSVLVILSVISVIVISLLAVSQQESSVTNFYQRSLEADLAVEHGFLDACQLLTHLAELGPYSTTLVTQPNRMGSEGDGLTARYTFISKMEAGSVTHYPLFSGGTVVGNAVSNIAELQVGTGLSADLLQSSPIVPEVAFDSDANVGSHLSTYGLTYLDDADELQAETTAPLIGQITIPSDSDERTEQRYSFWVEDLEGYPNIDLVGGHRNGNGDFEFPLAVDEAEDNRVDSVFTELPNQPEIAVVFEAEFGNQTRSGLIAAGLSPQEIMMVPRELPNNQNHPFDDMLNVLANRNEILAAGSHLAQAPLVENRFVKGFQPYYTVPRVPFNHGYPDAGELKFKLNEFVNGYSSSSDQEAHIDELKQYIVRNLPAFEERKGGFPEDYVATLVANMIDYADSDSKPTIRKNEVQPADFTSDIPLSLVRLESKEDGEVDTGQSNDYRGVDTYLPVNEFFYRITLDSISNAQATFTVSLFAEFWNPFTKPVTMEDVTANFWFVEPFQFLGGIATYNFNTPNYSWKEAGSETIDYPQTNEPLTNSQVVTVPANSYLVHDFGKIQWVFDLEQPTVIDSIGSPSSSGVKDGKAQMQLLIGGQVVDQSGRPYHVNSSNQEQTGYNIPRFRDSNSSAYTFLANRNSGLSAGDFMMVYYRPANERQIQQFGTFLGDPFMSYYGGGHAQNVLYRNSTPGTRNFYDHSNPDLLKAETRLRNWPDRGFDEPHGDQPSGVTDELPTSSQFPAFVSSRIAAAPFRMSNSGRYFAATELGNLHDPVMWMVRPEEFTDSQYAASSVSRQRYMNFEHQIMGVDEIRTEVDDSGLYFYPDANNTQFEAVGDSIFFSQMFGGGNTLRIARKEHPLFDKAGMRASQLLDLLEVGVNGSNLAFTSSPQDYSQFDDRIHYLPAAANNAMEAAEEPYSLVYESFAHAESSVKRIHGQLNINTAPTVFEIESLLRSPFMLNELLALPEDNTGELEQYGLLNLIDGSDSSYPVFRNGLNEADIPDIARGLIQARPFASKSHLARVLSELIYRYDALPIHHNDQIAEEPVARVLNLTHFTSRHFRIFVQGDVIRKDAAENEEPIARSTKVYEVYIEQEMDAVTGEPVKTACRVLSNRDL